MISTELLFTARNIPKIREPLSRQIRYLVKGTDLPEQPVQSVDTD